MRSHNDAEIIRRTINGLLSQTGVEFEILSFDDSSTDGTLEIIESYPQIKRFPPENLPYNPARVLNRAVSLATGDIIVFNNSDAVPLSNDFLAKLISPLADKNVGAVFGNQLCRNDAAFLVKKDNFRAFGDGRDSANWRHFFSLVTSGARREVLMEHKFDPKMQYSEDIEWSYRLKQLGFKIVYVADAKVEHSHNYTYRQMWKRFYNEGYAEAQIFGSNGSFWVCFKQFVRECMRDVNYEIVKLKPWMFFPGVIYRIIQKYAIYRGNRAGVKEFKQP